jgi:transposase
MVQCGWVASRKKDSYYKAQFNRLRGRHGAKRRSAPWPLQCLLQSNTDLGADHFDRRSTEIKARRFAAQIAKLGYEVEIRPLQQAA